MPLKLNSTGGGSVTLDVPNTASTYTVTIPASTGTMVTTAAGQTVEFAAGTAAAPSITTTGDTNNGIYFPAADTVAVATNGIERVKVDSSGRSTFPYQPLFHVYGTTTQNWSGAAAYQTVAFNTSITFSNHPSGWNTGTYTFTAPVAGTYLFIAKITQTGTATGPQGYLFVNGVATGTEMMISYSTAYLSSTGQQFLQLAANDAVTFRVINNNSTTFSLDLSRCSLTGILIA